MLRLFGWRKSREADLEHLENLRQDIRSAEYDQPSDAAYHQAKIVLALSAIAKEHKAQGRDGGRQQTKVLFWTRLAFFGLVAYTAVTVWLAVIGREANKLSAVSGRAWMDVSADENTLSVKWEGETRANFIFEATAKNKGNSPASYVFFSPKVFIDEGGLIEDPAKLVLDQCGRNVIKLGTLVFPGAESNVNRQTSLSADQIARGRYLYAKAMQVPLSKVTAMRVTLLLCVSYLITGNATPHRTGRLYTITGPDGSWKLPIGQDFLAGQMHLEEEHIEEYGD